MANIPRAIPQENPAQAPLSSCLAITALATLFSLALWPNLVTAIHNPDFSLRIRRAASSPKTLWIMLVIAAIGTPLAPTYATIIYWTFRRRVEIGQQSY